MDSNKQGQKYKIDTRKWPGVYGYQSIKRRVQGRPDICYYITYRDGSRLRWEKVGWKSEGYTPQIADGIRSKRIRIARHGGVVKTAKEIGDEKRRTDRTLNEIKKFYFESDRGLNLKGRKTDLNRFEKHLQSVIGERRVSSLSPFDIDRVKSKMKDKAPATVSNTLELLRRIINYGIRNDLCPVINFKIELPTKDNQVTEYLSLKEAQQLNHVLASWKRRDVARMLKLALVTGLRRGEIFKLKDQYVDFVQGIIFLRTPKGGKDVTIPLNSIARQIIKNQQLWRDKTYPNSSFIFPGVGGNMRVDCSAAKRIKQEARLPKKFRIFHGLRHHFAVTLANSGEFSLDMIGELLTHKSEKMTKRYAKFLPGTMQKASDRAASLINDQLNTKTQKDSDNVININ